MQVPRILHLLAVATFGAVAVASVSTFGTVATSQQVRSTPERLAQMEHHFSQVSLIHEALVRGDLRAVSEPASTPGGSRGSEGCGRINGAVCCRDAAGREAGGRCTRLAVCRGGHSVHAARLWRLSSNRWNNARPSDPESP